MEDEFTLRELYKVQDHLLNIRMTSEYQDEFTIQQKAELLTARISIRNLITELEKKHGYI